MDRRKIFGVTLFLSFVALVCAIAGASGLSTRAVDIKRIPWSTSHGEGYLGSTKVNVYVGVQAIVTDITIAGKKTETKTKWSDVDCKSDNCKDCKTASRAIYATVIIGCVVILVSMLNQAARGFTDDSMANKAAGMVIDLVGFAVLLASLVAFGRNCYDHLPENYVGVDVDNKLGAGFVLVAIATVVEFLVLLTNCLVPSPEGSSTLTQRLTGR